MEVTIDALGRILIPKRIRERLGLDPLSKLDLLIDDGTIRIKPKGSKVELVETEAGALVISGLPPITHEQMEEIRSAEYERRFLADGGE